VAKVCGLRARTLVVVYGDAHVYLNHIEGLKKQLSRKPYPFPRLLLEPKTTLSEYTLNDMVLEGYVHHDVVQLEMAV
jgi:thymidylate synthase